jgi:SnoaL-like polyketide cyclase
MSEAVMSKMERPKPDAATLIRRWLDEVWNKGMSEAIDELFPQHAVMWGVGRPEAASQGPAEFKEFYAGLRSACPDVKITLDQVVQEGDTAFARWTAIMTHTGEGLGIPATNRQLKICGMSAGRA